MVSPIFYVTIACYPITIGSGICHVVVIGKGHIREKQTLRLKEKKMKITCRKRWALLALRPCLQAQVFAKVSLKQSSAEAPAWWQTLACSPSTIYKQATDLFIRPTRFHGFRGSWHFWHNFWPFFGPTNMFWLIRKVEAVILGSSMEAMQARLEQSKAGEPFWCLPWWHGNGDILWRRNMWESHAFVAEVFVKKSGHKSSDHRIKTIAPQQTCPAKRPQLFDEKKSYYGAPRGWLLTFTAGLAEPIVPGKETVQGDGLSWCWMKIWLFVVYIRIYISRDKKIYMYIHISIAHEYIVQ